MLACLENMNKAESRIQVFNNMFNKHIESLTVCKHNKYACSYSLFDVYWNQSTEDFFMHRYCELCAWTNSVTRCVYSVSCHIRNSLSPPSFYYTSTCDQCTECRTKAAVFHPLCVCARQHPDDLLQHFHKRCFSSAVGGLWVWFTKHAHWPCELAPVTLLPPCLSAPDHTAPVTVLALPSGYNYSAFCCSPSPLSLPLSCFFCLSLSQLGWVLTLRSRRRAAGPLLCVHSALNATHYTAALNRWGVLMQGGKGKGRRGVLLTGCQGLWAGGEVGVVGEDLLPSNPPTSLLSLSLCPVSRLILCLSVCPCAARGSLVHFPVPLPAGGKMLQSTGVERWRRRKQRAWPCRPPYKIQ